MAALTATSRVAAVPLGPKQDYSVKASTTVHDGSLICKESATAGARPCASALTAPEFLGLSIEKVVLGASGAKVVRAFPVCDIIVDAIAGATDTDEMGEDVYAVTDNISQLTLTSTLNTKVGKLTNFVDGKFHVRLTALAYR